MLFKVIFIGFFCHFGVNAVLGQQCEVEESLRAYTATCEFLYPPGNKDDVDTETLCQCEEGSVLLNYQNTTCISDEQCPSECSNPNLFWNDCGSKCPKTCQKPDPQACTKICVPGCFCEDGLILNEVNMECIAPEDCPK